jgi:hypothetical protein
MDIPADQLEVYTQFGIAAEMAQVLEMDAGNVAVAYLALFIDTDKITPEQSEAFCSLIKDLDRQTLGQLLRSVKRFGTYDDTILETVDEALTKRNYLMHRFFPFHNFALFSVEGRKEMITELDEIQRKLGVASQLLNGICDTLHRLAGRNLDEHRERLTERLLTGGGRVPMYNPVPRRSDDT